MIQQWQFFVTAAENNDHTTVAQLRSQFSDARLGFVLLVAATRSSVEVVAELMKNPSDDIVLYATEALERAAQNGNAEILKLLLPYADPAKNENNALLWAVFQNHQDCVDLLFDVSDADTVWQIVNERRAHISEEAFYNFEQRIIARSQHATLTQAVADRGYVGLQRKM